MSFAKSDALFPPVELRTAIAAGFESQYRVLCFGPFSRWDDGGVVSDFVLQPIMPLDLPVKAGSGKAGSGSGKRDRSAIGNMDKQETRLT